MTALQRCSRLAAALSALRDGTGLSLIRLAAKTTYSKSSWERYLNGKALPPREAVEQLCALAGVSPEQTLVLWELAEASWSRRAGNTGTSGQPPSVGGQHSSAGTAHASPTETRAQAGAAPAAEADGTVVLRRHRRARSVSVMIGALGLLAAGVLLLTTVDFGGLDELAGAADASPSFAGPMPGCQADSCTGKHPEESRCATAAVPPSTLAERTIGGTVVRVRRSELCRTVWVRIDRGEAGDRVEISAPGADPQQAQVQDGFDEVGSLSTTMAAVADAGLRRVQACLIRGRERHCFTVGE
ncbi:MULTISPECIES: helix-turn-helix domain-containing protein [unclassified Streptomyces]|uniref:helix-turn-helix domain-containing protein n=1 Tax=unclassified Streptomyces TaxID=2593676 RepID=UPI003795CB41